MALKKKDCSIYPPESAEARACRRYNWYVTYFQALSHGPGGGTQIPADVLTRIETLLKVGQEDIVSINESDTVLNIINILRDHQLTDQAIDLSQKFTGTLNITSSQDAALLSRNMQLQGRLLESAGKVVEAQQAFDMAIHVSQLAGQIMR